MPDIILIPAIVIGAVIGLIELFFIHADQNFAGSHWIGHGFHATIFAIIATFINMNVDYALGFFPSLSDATFLTPLIIQVIVGLILAIKIYAVSAVTRGARGTGMHEKLIHTLIIGALTVAAPYIYPMIAYLFPEGWR